MAGRELEAVQRAVDLYKAGSSVRAAAQAAGISEATLQRGLNRRGIEKRGAPSGPAHHSYIDGRKSAARAARSQG